MKANYVLISILVLGLQSAFAQEERSARCEILHYVNGEEKSQSFDVKTKGGIAFFESTLPSESNGSIYLGGSYDIRGFSMKESIELAVTSTAANGDVKYDLRSSASGSKLPLQASVIFGEQAWYSARCSRSNK